MIGLLLVLAGFLLIVGVIRITGSEVRDTRATNTRRYADHFIPCAGESSERAAAEAHADESMRAVLGGEWS